MNEHNAWIPRDHWLEDWEKDAIIKFYRSHPDDGYRRVAYMMLDAGTVAASPSSVYRFIVHHEIREQMTEQDVEIIVQRALEAFPDHKPRIISDNGPQFVAKDFKAFIRLKGMDHVRTSPYYPQSNGKLERWHKSLKSECIRPKVPLNLDEAQRLVADYVEDYNHQRLHSAIGYVTPADKLAGKAPEILENREQKLAQAREKRAENRRKQREMDALKTGFEVS